MISSFGPLTQFLAHVGRWLRPVGVLTIKELRQLIRDRVLLIFVIYIFTGAIMNAASEMSSELRDAVVVVYDADQSAASRELVYRLRPPYFRLAGEVGSAAEGMRLLDRGDATLLLDIPEGFERDLLGGRGRAASVQMFVDTSKANRGFLASSYGGRILAGVGQEAVRTNLMRSGVAVSSLPGIEQRPRMFFNPTLEESWFGTISELLTEITVACFMLPAAALVREKERGTIEQLLVSPLTPLQVMSSKVVAMVFVTLIGTAASVYLIMQPLFGVPMRGSAVLFFALAALCAFANAGLGLAAATFARNSAQVGMLVLMIVMPIIMLSGTHSPLEGVPLWLRLVSTLFPMRHFVDIAYGILLRSAGMNELWRPVLSLAVLGCLTFAVGLWRFRRQFH